MDVQLWAYPWDLDAVGTEAALDEMQALGVTSVGVATSYHAGRFVAPRLGSGRLYYPEDGTVHVPVDDAGAGAVRPLVSAFGKAHPDLLDDLIARAARRGMAVASWTVMLHNSRLGLMHPEASVENAYGDRLVFSLCPSNPDVRRYATTLAGGLAHRYGLAAIEVESLGYMGLVHEYHHEKDGVGLTPADEVLLSLCFCVYCIARAEATGVDAGAARAFVRETVDAAMARETPAGAAAFPVDALVEVPALAPYLRLRVDTVHSLLAEVKAAIGPDTELRVLDGDGPTRGPLFGLDYGRVLGDADTLCVCLYNRTPEETGRRAAEACEALGGARRLRAAFRLFYPEMASAEAFADKVRAAHDAGIEAFSIYNYGLVPKARLDWIRRLRAVLA